MKIIRKKQDPLKVIEAQKLLALNKLLKLVENNYNTKAILKAYDEHGKAEAVKVCKKELSNSGASSNGYWVSGKDNGVQIQIFEKPNYTNSKLLLAETLMPYSEVVEYVLKNRGEVECTKPKPKKILKPKSKSKKLLKRPKVD